MAGLCAHANFIARSLERAATIASDADIPADRYQIGPMHLVVHTAGAELRQQLSPALAHLISEPIPANVGEWTIYAIDGHETGEGPPAQWDLPITSFDHQLRVHSDGDGYVLAADPDRGIWSMANIEQKQALYWARDARRLPDWEPGGPYRLLLHVAAQAEGLQLVHAAAVATESRGILLAGPGGSGKSTTTLAMIMRGAETVGEDFVVLAPGDPPVAHALYDTLNLTGMATSLCPDVMAAVANPGMSASEKARIHLCRAMPHHLRLNIRIHAIMTLRLGYGDRTLIRQCGQIAAMQSLAPSTAFLLRVNREETLARVSALARSLPAFDVILSGNPREAAEAISACAKDLPA